jgi:hypothetical protein
MLWAGTSDPAEEGREGVGGGKFDGENFQVRALSLLLRDMFGWPVERHAGNR